MLTLIARHRRAAEGAETEGVVKLLDGAVHEATAIRHGARTQVGTPVRRELVVHRDVVDRRLEIHEIVFAGQVANGLHILRAELAPSRRFQAGQVFFHLGTDGPGVLEGHVIFDRPASRLGGHGVGRSHVEPHEAQRRQVTFAHQAIELAAIGVDLRRETAEHDCRDQSAYPLCDSPNSHGSIVAPIALKTHCPIDVIRLASMRERALSRWGYGRRGAQFALHCDPVNSYRLRPNSG